MKRTFNPLNHYYFVLLLLFGSFKLLTLNATTSEETHKEVLYASSSELDFAPNLGMSPNVAMPPPAGTETLPSGTLIIPMDNTLQGSGGDFNLRAYGLAVTLLHADIPLKWIIEPGKAKDGIDFTANAQQVAPTTGGAASRNFRAGPIAVYPGFEAQALTVINSFNAGGGQDVNVYELTQAATVNVEADLTQKPTAAALDNGGNQDIHGDIYAAAGLTEGVHYYLNNDAGDVIMASDITASSCFTFISEAHADEGEVSASSLNNVRDFLESGGNFLAQCAAGRAYENDGTTNLLITANGVEDPGIGGNIVFDNADRFYVQIEGGLADEGGSAESFRPIGGAYIGNDVQRYAYDSNDGGNFKAYAGQVPNVVAGAGGYAHYLAGHNYDGNDVEQINGRRMFLNAFISPTDRPTACNIDIGPSINDDVATVTECGVSIGINVLDNDINNIGGTLTVTLTGADADGNIVTDKGSFINNGDGTISYTPNATFTTGTDVITYEACNADGLCDEATITVTSTTGDCPENTPITCTDGIDNDGDGLVDCDDPECIALPNIDCDGDGVSNGDEVADGTDPLDPCDFEPESITLPITTNVECPENTPNTCTDGIDNDRDGLTDCEDPECVALPDIDCDGDGVTNGDELADGTDPSDPCDFDLPSVTLPPSDAWNADDCDGDGVSNGTEIVDGTNPLDPCDFIPESITLPITANANCCAAKAPTLSK